MGGGEFCVVGAGGCASPAGEEPRATMSPFSAAAATTAAVGVPVSCAANPGDRSRTPATPAARLNSAEAVTAACRRVSSNPKSRAILTINPPGSVFVAPGGGTTAAAASGAAVTTGATIGADATTGAATGGVATTGTAAGAVVVTTGALATTGVGAGNTGVASGIAAATGVTGAAGGGEVATGLGGLGAGRAVGIAGRAVGTGAAGAFTGGSTTIGSIRVTVRWRVAHRGATGRAQRVARPAGRTHAGPSRTGAYGDRGRGSR